MTPYNASTGKDYQGINAEALSTVVESRAFPVPGFFTYRQALDMGQRVRRGEKAAGRVAVKGRYFCVFNVAQADALAPGDPASMPKPEPQLSRRRLRSGNRQPKARKAKKRAPAKAPPAATPKNVAGVGVVFSRKAMLTALKRCALTVERKPTMPILSHVKIEIELNGLRLTTTNLEAVTVVSIPAEGGGDTACVPLAPLQKALNGLPADAVTMTSPDKDTVMVEADGSRRTLVAMPPSKFPVVPSWPEGAPQSRVFASSLAECLARVAYAVSTDETRYNLNGVLMEATDKGLRIVATDGHRLAVSEINDLDGTLVALLCKNPITVGCVKVMRSFLDSLGATKVTVALAGATGSSNAQLHLCNDSNDVRIAVPTPDHHFPDWKQIVPSKPKHAIRCNRADLQKHVGRLRKMVSTAVESVTLTASGATLELAVRERDIGTATESVAARVKGKPETIAVNAKYFVEALDALPGEEVSIQLTDPLSAILITPVGIPGQTVVIMPMRI